MDRQELRTIRRHGSDLPLDRRLRVTGNGGNDTDDTELVAANDDVDDIWSRPSLSLLPVLELALDMPP